MGSFNSRPMAIGVLERIRALALACCKQRLHLLSGMQGQAAPSRSRAGGPTGTDLTITLRKLHLDQGFACILDRCPARADPPLWAGDRLGLPIDGKVREVVAGLRLIPVGLEGGANQVHSIARLRLDEIGNGDISRINEMVIGEEFLVSQIVMNRGEDPLIADGSRRGLDMSDQLRGLFIARLGEMHFISHPQRGPFLAIPRVEVIGRIDELSRGQGWFWAPSSPLLSWLKLLLPNGVQGGNGWQRFHPFRGGRSVQRSEQSPAIGTYLIGA